MSDTEPFLLPQHQKLIEDSGIADAVARDRGYRSVTTKAELRRLGFASSQCLAPCLLLPVHGVSGEIVSYQIRPDTPRIRDGKALKYETPARSRMAIDVPPRARAMLGNPDIPLIVTEGIRKADAAASLGLCCIDVLGVWNWRGSNDHGGKTALPDFETIALNDRDVYLCFDSDVITKPAVRLALERLSAFLMSRGASVKVLLLPMGEGGTKTGLDDYLAAGHTANDLFALAIDRLPGPEPASGSLPDDDHGPYRIVDGCLAFVRPSGDDESVIRLTNFTAEIREEVIADDGQSERGELVIAGTIRDGRHLPDARVPTSQFEVLRWVSATWGTGAIIAAGMGNRDRVREAIQRLSPAVERRREYTHPGWRKIDGDWCFLTQDAVIGASGAVPGIVVRLDGPAGMLRLPPPPAKDDRQRAMESTVRLLDLAPDRITVPLLGGVFRALLNTIAQGDVVLFLVGPSGVLKSELAAVIQRCFGPDFDRLKMPASWTATANALERIAFDFKDCLLVIDDFAPSGTMIDVRKYHQTADRVIRGAGNATGRERMNADGSIRESYPPRALMLGTGEDIPSGYSIRARMIVLEVGKGDVDTARLSALQQTDGRRFPSMMLAGYVRWLAGNMERLRTELGPAIMVQRSELQLAGSHARTPDALAGLGVAWKLWIRFGLESELLSREQAAAIWSRVWNALLELGTSQADHLVQEDPVRRFLDLLTACISSGHAYVAGPAGDEPATPEAWGWRERIIGTGEYTRQEWQPQGRGVGWLDDSGLYLEPAAAYQAVQQFGNTSGTSLTVSAPTLWKRLDEAGLLRSTEQGVRGTRYVRKSFASSRRKVLHLAVDVLDSGNDPSTGDGDGPAGQSTWSVQEAAPAQTDQQSQAELPWISGSGQSGQFGQSVGGASPAGTRLCVRCDARPAALTSRFCRECEEQRHDTAA